MTYRLIILSIIALASSAALAQKTIDYRGEELLVYPFEQSLYMSGNEFRMRNKGEFNIFIPLGDMADGKYIQFSNAQGEYSYKKKKRKELNWVTTGYDTLHSNIPIKKIPRVCLI